MERRKQEEIEVSTSPQTTGTLALKNFTIPRKKRSSGQVVLERCPEECRDYTLIQSKLRDSRAEMRAKGRHGREMEEILCFLVASDQDMPHMYQDGLKVLYGKVRKIAPNWKKTQDPIVSFDCHMSKDAVSPRDTPIQQNIGSSVFLFDFDENQELNERPRQCLPYAVVSYAPATSVILTTSPNLPFSPTSHDAADRFQACTVAQRKGKGDTATITFKHFGTTQNPEVDYLYQKADVQSIPISHNSMLPHTTVSQNPLREEENPKLNTAGTRETWDKWDTTPQSPIDQVSTVVYSSRSVRDPRLSRREANQQSDFSEAETTCTASRNKIGPQKEDENSGFVTATSESDPTDENSSSSGQCEMASEHPNSINTSLLDVKVSDTKNASAAMIKENSNFSRQEQNQNFDVDSPETQLISKLRDYLTKFESSVKKQEATNEGLMEKPLMWITLDSTAHKQQLADKSQYRSRPDDEAQTGPDVFLLMPAESKRGRSSQAKRTSKHKSKRARLSLGPSVSPDSTSVLDTFKETSPQPSVNNGTAAPTEISLSNEAKQQLMQSKESTSSIICSQDPVDTCGNAERIPHTNREMVDDSDVSSSFVSSDLSVSDVSKTLKMADQTSSLAELGSLRAKCKNMLQKFILRFERDQIVSFNQSFVSRNLIIEQYLDHPPAHVDLKYEAVNSYLELQMMMEAWQFVENKMNFLKNKPTFRSLLWYDPSLYGELYKGEVGFQQQSSLFTSFQKMLAQEGYTKLQEYYMTHVSRIYQQLLVNPDASYYMYLKSKREVFEIEAALRNPHDVKYFFLSVPLTAMINFGDSLESLENVHKVIMSFVETPSDQLPGTFDVGKAEHLSITCRYLQEKAFFIRSCKETLTKVSWFGIEHLLYDASKILIWQDAGQGVSNEVLKMYKNSNPQIIFGVTESGVTLVNKVHQPRLSVDGAEKSAEKQTDASQKHKPSQSSVPQTVNSGTEADYSVSKRRFTESSGGQGAEVAFNVGSPNNFTSTFICFPPPIPEC
ncbi:Testis-expressed protein 15 [Triplophysa tibetana]|uniref:Testis-expressed protein 15 n=1 Tax=Triplophysa tibetana TaxID=1572043 RepID=A0A5A9N0N9_9TELE|nr:Testis-expressed protein 15 [Triplophysa tibetana]